MLHVMIDLETMGMRSTSAMIAIGAVDFDTVTGEVGEGFYKVVDLESCMHYGLTLDASTILWWMKQGDAARDEFKRPGLDLPTALVEFSKWMKEVGGKYVWGNGSDFDNAILSNAYEKACITRPWAYWDNRCYRTMKNLNSEIKMARSGVHHNALHDAKSQAEHLLAILASS